MDWIVTLLVTGAALGLPVLAFGIPGMPGVFWFLHTPPTLQRVQRYGGLGLVLGSAGAASLVVLSLRGITPWGWTGGVTLLYGGLLFGYVRFHPNRLFAPVRSTRHRAPEDVENEVAPDEEIVALVTPGGGPRAYTMATLLRPHGAWDELDETPRFVTWCSLSYSGAALDSEVRPGERADFTTVTAMHNNVLFYDRVTGNFVQQLGERVLIGSEEGTRLGFVPVWHTRWDVWRRWHPDSRICHQPSTGLLHRGFYSIMNRIHEHLPDRSKPKYRGLRGLDGRLAPMERVLGVEHAGESRACPLALFRPDRSVTAFHIGGEAAVILTSPEDGLGGAFSRRLGERELTFEPSFDGAVARDVETGSRWSPTGYALSGPLAGELLTPLRFYWGVFWFRWALSHPDTELVEALPDGGGDVSAVSSADPGTGL